MTEIAEGAKAPDFTVETAKGPVSLSDFEGYTLVVFFYPKDDTSGCTKEAQEFSSLLLDFSRAGAMLLGVSKDSVKSHEKFTVKYDLTVPLGSDPEGQMIAAFGSWVEKSLYGRKYMGIDRSTFIIRDGVIQKIWRKVKVPGHAQAVLDAVRA